MTKIIEEFDAVTVTNASIQFFENGIQQNGELFGFLGKLEGETELREIVKNIEGSEAKKITKVVKITITASGHIPLKVTRDIFGLTAKDLKPGVWAYGAKSKGKNFAFTADVIDEFQDEKKLIAFPNCVSTTGFKISVENGADEVAEMEMEFTAMLDVERNCYYEAIESEVEDATVISQWHTKFTPELVASAVPIP